jgi:hypothetical protein
MKSLVSTLFLSVLLSSCILTGDKSELKFKETITTIINPIEEDKDKIYVSLQKRIFNVSCIGCHGPKKPKRLDLTKKENIIENFQDIVDRMRDISGVDTMPPFEDQNIFPAVKEELILELEEWKKSLDEQTTEQDPVIIESKPETPPAPTENPDEPWL